MHFADIWESIADTIADRDAIVQGARRISWATFDDEAARFASFLAAQGVGVGTTVGMYLYNCPEYLVAQHAAFKIRAVPVNVNYRYLDDELTYLLDNADIEVLVYSASLGERVERVRARSRRVRAFVEVDDGGQAGSVTGAVSFIEAVAETPAPRQARSADDLYMLYTGGTTGMPKGVMYRIGDIARNFLLTTPPLLGLPPITGADGAVGAVAELRASDGLLVVIPGPPLMHGTGIWMGAMAPHSLGSTVVLLESRSFDAGGFVREIERERAGLIIIVGDAFARPLLAELDTRAAGGDPADLSSLRIIASSGAMLASESKARLLEHIPAVTILDLLGSSEGGMAGAVTNAASPPAAARFVLNPGVRVLRDDDTDVEPGSGQVGAVALTGVMTPIGYYKDPEKSARTFREIDGVRYSFPGDMATVEPDGTIHLLGRGSTCINSGGEKVFPEEVEEAIKTHPAIADCLVIGVDDARFGQAVVAVVSHVSGYEPPTAEDVIAHVKSKLAGYKAPRRVVATERVPRAPNGKADYQAARAVVEAA